NLKTLWDNDAPPYLRCVRDDYCITGPHYRWTDVIDSAQLANALRSDSRTDVGQNIRELTVVRYDQTGRAELIEIAGDRRRTVSGWEFKLIVGRALGWNVLKSSRFDISRSGSQFVFRGGGFGHGLGLCQEGAHVMAQRGQSYQQILAHYFPGTSSFASKVQNHSWIGSVQGAVATWSNDGSQESLGNLARESRTRSLPLRVLTRSKLHSHF